MRSMLLYNHNHKYKSVHLKSKFTLRTKGTKAVTVFSIPLKRAYCSPKGTCQCLNGTYQSLLKGFHPSDSFFYDSVISKTACDFLRPQYMHHVLQSQEHFDWVLHHLLCKRAVQHVSNQITANAFHSGSKVSGDGIARPSVFHLNPPKNLQLTQLSAPLKSVIR